MKRWVATISLPVLALLLCPWSCASQDNAVSPSVSAGAGGGGASGSGGSAGEGGSGGEDLGGWEPIEGWTGQLPEVKEEKAPFDCGPGCRLVFPVPILGRSYYDHGYNTQGVFDEVSLSDERRGLFWSDYGSPKILVASPPAGTEAGFTQPSRWGRYLSLNLYKYPEGRVQVLDLEKGLQRTFFHFIQDTSNYATAGATAVVHTLVNDKYVFWINGYFLYRADLQTGATAKLFSPGPLCDRLCALDNGIVCSNSFSQVLFIDQETGEPSPLNASSHLQAHGSCSQDRKQVAWIDYRDYPGTLSTSDAVRGGEVYVHDLGTNKTRRVTFDSPDNPRQKIRPNVDGDLVVWSELPPGIPTAEWVSTLYGMATELVKLDLKTGKKCHLAEWGNARISLRGRFLYTYQLNQKDNEVYLMELDLEHPDLPWVCD